MKEKRKIESSGAWDLYAVYALTALACVSITVPPLDSSPLRTVLGLLLAIFLPGYAIVCALFPEKKGLGLLERAALSFGLSIAATPLLGLVLNYTPFGIRKDSVLIVLCFFIMLCAVIAHIRRSKLAPGDRFSLAFKTENILPENRLDKALTVLLLLSIVISLAVLVYVIVSPKQGERFTEFYILGPNGKAEDYPTSMRTGDTGTVRIGVVNHEYEQVNYTLKIALGNESLRQQRIKLVHNQTYDANFSFVPIRNGTEKLSFDLFRNESATEPYRSLHLWVKTGE